MSSTILVTGGAGFIGREAVRKLIDNCYTVIAYDLAEQVVRQKDYFNSLDENQLTIKCGSILDRTALRAAFQDVDIVLHLAAMLGVRRTEENQLACLESNITGTDNVLNACASHDVKKVIVASSSEVYGEPSENPVRETSDTKGKSVYAVSKMAGEELTKGYHQLYPKLQYTITRFFNTYGEGQVAQFVLARFVRNVLEGENPIVYGKGDQIRSYCHVDDTTEALVKIIENPVSNGKIYNIGNSTQVTTLKALAEKVIEVLAPNKGITVDILGGFEGSDRMPEREVHARHCDISLAKMDLGFDPKISLEEGIRRIANHGPIFEYWPATGNNYLPWK